MVKIRSPPGVSIGISRNCAQEFNAAALKREPPHTDLLTLTPLDESNAVRIVLTIQNSFSNCVGICLEEKVANDKIHFVTKIRNTRGHIAQIKFEMK